MTAIHFVLTNTPPHLFPFAIPSLLPAKKYKHLWATKTNYGSQVILSGTCTQPLPSWFQPSYNRCAFTCTYF